MAENKRARGAKAVYTNDSAKYHVFQIVDDEIVGSIYLSKKCDPLPKKLNFTLQTEQDKGWRTGLKTLHGRARPGSKQFKKLQAALDRGSTKK